LIHAIKDKNWKIEWNFEYYTLHKRIKLFDVTTLLQPVLILMDVYEEPYAQDIGFLEMKGVSYK